MRAGVRPGLQILWVPLCGTGRFDSDTLPPTIRMSPRRRGKPKAFQATKEVRRLARLRVGSPPPVQKQESRKEKSPKHRKRALEHEAE